MTMAMTKEQQAAWLGGVVSCFGIMHIHTRKHAIELKVQSVKHRGMIKRFSRFTSTPVKWKKSGGQVLITGAKLQELWDRISPYVTSDRRLEFAVMVQERDRRVAEHQERLAYQRERANAPRSTARAIRQQQEASYDNSDPAIILIEGFVESEMADAYDTVREQYSSKTSFTHKERP